MHGAHVHRCMLQISQTSGQIPHGLAKTVTRVSSEVAGVDSKNVGWSPEMVSVLRSLSCNTRYCQGTILAHGPAAVHSCGQVVCGLEAMEVSKVEGYSHRAP